ncbi:FAD-dependent oxidoreductase, partial [Ilumatobacter sp.]|uniref:FAD-dependent oxidoreductase n=1 Tax=Ilumatobacter sp. TaxID=1967498 RepID=UPI003C4094C8
MNHTHSSDVIVIGGGLAGLAAAALVARGGHSVTVLERRGRLGGLATTDERSGFLFNQGPHALYRGGPAWKVLSELGIDLAGGRPTPRSRLMIDDRLQVLPTGPGSLLSSRALGFAEKVEFARLLTSLGKVDPFDHAGLTAGQWIDRNVGRDRPRRLLRALVRLTTYAGDIDTLSADVAIAQLQTAQQAVHYVDGGWQRIIKGLAARPGVSIETDAAVDELPDARVVIVAAGSPTLVGHLTGRAYDVGPSADVSCIDLGLSAPPPHDFVIGADRPFYFSNHSTVAKLAPEGSFVVSAMQYLTADTEPDPDMIWSDIDRIGIDRDDVTVSRRLHRMTAVSAIPTVETGGRRGRPSVTATDHDHVFIAGDWVGSEGHLADASIASALAASQAALAHLAAPSTV